MSTIFENIISVADGFIHDKLTSATLDQHASSMRMDQNYSFTINRLNCTITDVKKDIDRLDEEFGNAIP